MLLLVYFLYSPGSAQGQESTKTPFRVLTGLDTIYDDNVWQYSDSDRKAFESTPNDPFFQKTESLNDFIWEPYLSLSLRPFRRSPLTRFSADLTGDFYTRNPSLNFGTYRIVLEQKIWNKTFILLSYTVTPNMFIGFSRERRGAGVLGESVTTQTARFLIQREIKYLDMGLTAHYKFKNYNDPFNEQDSDIYGIGLISRVYSRRGFKIRIEYQFEQGLAAGRNSSDVCTIINGTNICPNDLSYLSNQFIIGPEVRFSRSFLIRLVYNLKLKQFTTDLTNDSNHYGRRDTIQDMKLTAYYELSKTIEAKAGYERVMRRTNNNANFYAFDENIATVGIDFLF
jgi:hypothetical protein